MSNDTTNNSGCAASNPSANAGYSRGPSRKEPTMTDIDRRLARLESRLVQLMLHMGLNPYEKAYDANQHQPRPYPRQRVPGRR